MELDPTLKSFDDYEKENSKDFEILDENKKDVVRRRRRTKRVLQDHEYEADVDLKQKSGRRARKRSLMEPHRQVLRNEKKNSKKYVVRTLPELLEQSEDRLGLYEGRIMELLTAHRCYSMVFRAPPTKHVLKRARCLAKRAALERAKRDMLRDAVADCGDSELMQREVLTALHQKHSSPGFGKDKEFVVDHNDPRDVARAAKKRAKKFRAKTKKRLELLKFNLDEDMAHREAELRVPDNLVDAARSLACIIRIWRDVVWAAHFDRVAITSEVMEKRESSLRTNAEKRALRQESIQVLRDMEALGCNVKEFVGEWAARLLAEEPRVGRKKSREST